MRADFKTNKHSTHIIQPQRCTYVTIIKYGNGMQCFQDGYLQELTSPYQPTNNRQCNAISVPLQQPSSTFTRVSHQWRPKGKV